MAQIARSVSFDALNAFSMSSHSETSALTDALSFMVLQLFRFRFCLLNHHTILVTINSFWVYNLEIKKINTRNSEPTVPYIMNFCLLGMPSKKSKLWDIGTKGGGYWQNPKFLSITNL